MSLAAFRPLQQREVGNISVKIRHKCAHTPIDTPDYLPTIYLARVYRSTEHHRHHLPGLKSKTHTSGGNFSSIPRCFSSLLPTSVTLSSNTGAPGSLASTSRSVCYYVMFSNAFSCLVHNPSLLPVTPLLPDSGTCLMAWLPARCSGCPCPLATPPQGPLHFCDC